ncbi:MAG TPA: hypothetical protein VNS80_04595, partial [Pseudolysinimonas sp.]|nr:hypothetical protein [Pseudolysinimonas sp.]
DAEFGYEVVRADAGVVSDGTLVGIDEETGDELTNTYSGTEDHGIAGSLGIGDTHTWAPIFAGDYQLTESIDAADPFALQSIVCTATEPGTDEATVVTVVDDGDVTGDDIPVFVGETTECVITNAADPASLELEKIATGIGGDVAWSFDFTISPDPQSGSATQTASGTGPGSDTISWDDLLPGETYTLTESPVDGWTAGDLTCEVGDGVLADASTDDGFQFVAAPGLAVECSLMNDADPGEIVVTKTAVGADGVFEFELTPLDENGDADGSPLSQSATTDKGTGTATFSDVLPGSRFAIAEVDPGSSWTAGDLTCEVTPAGSVDAVAIDVDDFAVDPGDAIACEVTNTAKGTITVVKVVEGADGEFAFTGDWLNDEFTIETDGGSGSTSFLDLVPGDYSVAEVLGDGYDGTKLVCSDTDNTEVDLATLTADITLDPGETVICTFTNSAWGVLVVDKVTVPTKSDVDFGFSWAADGEAGTAFTLADEDNPYTTIPIAPGTYTVTEDAKSGWALTGLVCTDPAEDDTDPVVDGATATVHVGLGETVLCTYTNAQRGPLEFDKVVTPNFPAYNGDGTWTVKYTLTVTSSSNIPEEYDLEDEFDFGAGIAVVSEAVAGPAGVTLHAGWDGDTDTVIAVDAEIPALGTHTYTVTVVVDPPEVSTVEAMNCVEAEDEKGTGLLNGGGITFWGDGSDEDNACAPLPVADLEITKDAPFGEDFEPADGPTQFAYTIAVKNLGPSTAEDAVLVDPLSHDLEFVSATGVGVTCDFALGDVRCQLGDLLVNATRTVTITVLIPVDYPLVEGEDSFTIHNVATTSTITPESDLTNNEDDADTTVLVTLALPPDDPELPTLAITGATIGVVATQIGLSLLALGTAFAVMAVRRRPRGRHTA